MPPGDLVEALSENPYSIAGFAAFQYAPRSDDWHTLLGWLRTYSRALRQNQLAQVLWLLLDAGKEYGGEEAGYWPVVASKLGLSDLGQVEQRTLGDWFLDGLQCFNYASPTSGRRNLGPILYHVGVTPNNYRALATFILSQLRKWGVSATNFDAATIASIVPESGLGNGLFMSTIRFLKSGVEEVEEVWRGLAKVLSARCAGEANWLRPLDELPLFMSHDAVLKAISDLDQKRLTGSAGFSIPTILFFPEYGQVVVCGDQVSTVVVTGENQILELGSVHEGTPPWRPLRTALPERVNLCWNGIAKPIERVLFNPTCFPGIWFNARSGRHHFGDPEPGRWYLLLKGANPILPGAEILNLDWRCLTGELWTAFGIELVAGNFVAEVDGRQFELPISKRRGAKPMLEKPFVIVRLLESDHAGEEADLFDKAPVIENPGPFEIEIEAEHIGKGTTVRCLVASKKCRELPLSEPGVYCILFRPVSGRQAYWQPLEVVAYAPGASGHLIEYSSDYASFSLKLHFPSKP